MTKRLLIVAVVALLSAAAASAQAGDKVLFVDSYHEGYAWSDGIVEGIEQGLAGSGVELRVIHMDTKRNASEAFAVSAAEEARRVIQSWNPDVVIAADDNASKYLIVPYYADGDIPFVFCGVNWDASGYGFPTDNVTGMVEVALVKQVVDHLGRIADGSTVGYLAADRETARKEASFYNRELGAPMEEVYVETFGEWRDAFVAIQNDVDILIVGNPTGIADWDDGAAQTFAEANTRIPSGSLDTFTAPMSLLTIAKSAQEQGVWSATTALRILRGTPVSSIDIVPNEDGLMFVNTNILRNGGFRLPVALIKAAEIIN